MKIKPVTSTVCVLLTFFTQLASATLHDRGGGLIYDDILNVTWLQDATYSRTVGAGVDGHLRWVDASNWAQQLSYYDSVRKIDWTDWRLPHVLPIDGSRYKHDLAFDGTSEVGYNITDRGSELANLYYVSLGNKANPSLQLTQNVGPFKNLPTAEKWGDWFWTGTRYPDASALTLYYFDSVAGMQNVSDASNMHFAWVLRDGDVGAVPEPNASLLLASGGILVLCFVTRQRRRAATS